MKKAALYLRVSTEDQHTENQRPELERMATARGYEIVHVFEEKVSGASERRPEFDAMMKAARRPKVDAVFIWAIDRLGRSMLGITGTVLELDRRNVELISYQETWLDTASPVRSLLIAIFSWLAEWERARIIERTNAGLDRARARGVKLGRPFRAVPMAVVSTLRKQGKSLRAIAKRVGVPLATVHRALARSKNAPPSGPSQAGGRATRKSAFR
jgi:DNA invertase Pin-like site-specific DNA recombinase